MFCSDRKLICGFLFIVGILSILNINPTFSLFAIMCGYIFSMGQKELNGHIPLKKTANISPYFGKKQENVEINYGERHSKAFLEMIPVVSHPQKKIVFYHCKIYHPESCLNDLMKKKFNHELSFFECLKFLQKDKEIDRNIRYILDLTASILNDDTYFDLFLYYIENNSIQKEQIIFDLKYEDFNHFSEKLYYLSTFGIRFNISQIPVDKIEQILESELAQSVYSCEVSQSQLLELVRDELMHEKIHSLHGYMTRLMVSDVRDMNDINELPNIVDYVCGKEFAKTLTIAI